MLRRCAPLCLLLVSLASAPAWAINPATQILPDTTQGFLSIPDVDTLHANFNQSDLGELLADPAMEPFAEDLRRQLQEKFSQTSIRLGIELADLEGVYAGELVVAALQPDHDPEQAAIALLVDVTGKDAEINELLAKIDRNMTARGATKSTQQSGGATLTVYDVPATDTRPQMKAVVTVHENYLLATDHLPTAELLLSRYQGTPQNTLAETEAYASIAARIQEESNGLTPDVSWFIDPFGYAEVVQAQTAERENMSEEMSNAFKSARKMIEMLRRQGFTAIQGVGGNVNFAVEGHELLHRTFVYAPAVVRAAGDTNTDRYDLAMRMLNFPNVDQLAPQPWVTDELASYASFNGELQDAFEYSETLVNDYVGDDQFFEDFLESLRDDPNSARIDLRADLVAHLGTRVTVMTDYVLPIAPESERLMVAIEVTNEEAVTETVAKAMQSDHHARLVEYHGFQIWEIVEPEAEVTNIEITGFGPPQGGFGPGPQAEEEEEERLVKNAAVTVANGQLLMSTHIDFLIKMLEEEVPAEQLGTAADFQHIDNTLTELGADEFCARIFTRTDEAYRPTYELLQQGRMPEAKTVLAQVLNAMMAPEDPEQIREQQIDGSELPDYQMVRRYLGPAGMYVQSEDTGWLIVGTTQSKHPVGEVERLPVEMADSEASSE